MAAQTAILTEVEASFAPVPVWRSAYQQREPMGEEQLAAFAVAAYGESDPLASPAAETPISMERNRRGTLLRLALPFVARADLDLTRRGTELVITLGSYRRVLALPAALARLKVAGAKVEDGSLLVRFEAADQAEAPARG